MKIKIMVWALTTCSPGEPDTCEPELFTTRASAEAALDAALRRDWDARMGDEGYPGAEMAQNRIAEMNGELSGDGLCGEWTITGHEIELPGAMPDNPPPPPQALAAAGPWSRAANHFVQENLLYHGRPFAHIGKPDYRDDDLAWIRKIDIIVSALNRAGEGP